MALSVAIGGGLRLKDLSALYKNQQPSGTGSSGTMICVALKVFLLEDIWRAEMLGHPSPKAAKVSKLHTGVNADTLQR